MTGWILFRRSNRARLSHVSLSISDKDVISPQDSHILKTKTNKCDATCKFLKIQIQTILKRRRVGAQLGELTLCFLSLHLHVLTYTTNQTLTLPTKKPIDPRREASQRDEKSGICVYE